MAKKAAKPAPAASPDGAAAKPERSKIKLALFVLAPLLVLGGGGYGAWAFFLAPEPEVHAEPAHEAPKHGDVDPLQVAALKAEAAAETSATYNFALAQMLKVQCGPLTVEALKTAADAEAAHDGALVHMSWQAALRRAGTITDKSCGRIMAEIDNAEFALEGGGAAADGHGAKAGGHDAKPAAH